DMALFDRLLAAIEAEYCIDAGRVVTFGFSAGAIWSNQLACKRSSAIRAAGAIEGMEPYIESPPTFSSCGAAVSYFAKQDDDDASVSLANAEVARDYWIGAGGCSATASPWPLAAGGDPHCVTYAGCRAPDTVVWCEYPTGGHTWTFPIDSQNL